MRLTKPVQCLDHEAQNLVAQVKQARQMNNTRTAQHVFANLYALLRRPVDRYLSRLSFLNATQREEVLSETFYRAYNFIETYQPFSNTQFLTWLCTIARNVAYDSAQSRSREIPMDHCVSLDDTIPAFRGRPRQTYGDVIASRHSTPEQSVLSSEVNTYYQKVLLDMKPVDMLILHWRIGEKMSHREIADRLKDTEGKPFTELCVRQRFHRSQKTLRQKMTRYWTSSV